MTFRLEIVKIVPPGDGLGYYKDKAVFVPGTTIGDLIEVSVVKEKKRYITAILEKIITPGRNRIEAPCPHYQDCGGCNLMHLSYKDQLDLKQKMLAASFANQQLEITPTFVRSPRETHYRFRATVKLRGNTIGFSAPQSHQISPIEKCCILSQGIKDQLPRLRKLGRNHCDFSLLESSSNGEIAVSVSENKSLVPLPGYPSQVMEDYGFGPITLQSGGFAQSNPFITKAICQDLVAEISTSDQVCELYCGSGTFSIPLAKKANSLTGFDISKKSILAAKQNVRLNNLNNTEFTAINVEKRSQLTGCNIIVVDPPRKGLGNIVLKQIGNSMSARLLYVSCNPASLARDSKMLVTSHHFKLLSVTGYDMYCHSHHSEVLAIFER